MANSSGGSKGSVYGPLGGFAVLILGPVFLIAFLALGSQAAANPNANGKQTSQYINSNPATSPLAGELADFQRFKDVNGYLSKNSPLLIDLQTHLQLIDSKLVAGTAYKTITAENVTKIKAVIQLLIADLANIKSQVDANTPKNAAKYLTDLTTNLDKLQTLSQNAGAPAVAYLASQMATANNDGKGSITYPSPLDDHQVTFGKDNQPVQLDCSGFVSYVLQKTGIFKAAEWSTTQDFATTKINDSRFQVVKMTDGGQIDQATILSLAQPGDLFVSNSLGSISSNPGHQNHVVIFLGTVNGVPTVAESTSGGGKSGPQFDSLQDRIDHHGHIQLILRPVGAAQ